jgi:hypothetical protein
MEAGVALAALEATGERCVEVGASAWPCDMVGPSAP